MNEKSEILVEELIKLSDENNNNTIKVNIFKYIGLCALDIICGRYFCFLLKESFLKLYIFLKNRNRNGTEHKCPKRKGFRVYQSGFAVIYFLFLKYF